MTLLILGWPAGHRRVRWVIRRALWRALAIFLVNILTTSARGQAIDEYQVKAAFLYNFAKFVEWPEQAFKAPTDPIAICVFGQNPFGTLLEEAVRGKIVADRTLVVHQITDVRKLSGCHIIFLSSSDRKVLRGLLEEMKTGGALTVGETEGFTADGGVVNFKLEGNRVRFVINMNAAAQNKLRISSKLLSLAQVVKK
jgi:hypothetical protein